MNTPRPAFLTLFLLLICCGCIVLLESSIFLAAAEDEHEALSTSTTRGEAAEESRRDEKEFVQQHRHHLHSPHHHHARRKTVEQQARTALRSWQPQDFPKDPADAECHSGASLHFCDPDRLLKNHGHHVQQLEQALKNSSNSERVIHLSPKCSRQQESNVFQVQYGVALVRKMDLQSRSSPLSRAGGANNPERAAEIFARDIHDTWGVGLPTDYCGGTGILLFLSDRDRTIYISRGAALEPVLTDHRLDQIIEHMKHLLRQQQYEQAILNAVQELDTFLAAGKPGWKERASAFVTAYLGYGFVFGIFGLIGFGIHKDRQERREYAKVSSQLSEMDQARAEALQGRFQAKSCPICLEDFKISKEDDGADNTREGKENRETDKGKTDYDPSNLRGSDGHPLKLLRCGHVYCDSCFSDWVSSGHHNKVDKCPICQQNVTEDSQGGIGRTEETRHTASDEDATSRAYRQYTRDRNFRLMRLHRRYPRFIRQDQIHQWTRVGYNGSYARDPIFVACNPALRAQHTSGSRSGGGRSRSGGSSFGGGRSGGGRGGRW